METTRRTFIKNTIVLAGGVTLLPSCLISGSNGLADQVGLQLYTIREAMDSDPREALINVAEIGYKKVESAGYANGKLYGFTGSEFSNFTKDLGLDHVSGHMSYGAFEDFDHTLEFMVDAGQKYAVLPWLSNEQRSSLDQYRKHAELLNKCGEKAASSGIKVCYHNHDFEFQELEGELPMNVLLRETDPEFVEFELDLYWISKVGLDPVQFFNSNKGRVSLWHVKDMNKTPDKGFTEVGNGVIDFRRIFDHANISGMKHFFVEQDISEHPMKSIETSFKNLKNQILS